MAGRQASGDKQGRGTVARVADRSDGIRNVVLVGPAGSGKTTLVETLLASAGRYQPGGLDRRRARPVCDFEDAEQRQQRSVAGRRARGPRRRQDQPRRHPRLRRLRGRGARRAACGRLRAVRDRRQRGRGRADPPRCGASAREVDDAARRRGDQARPRARRLRRRRCARRRRRSATRCCRSTSASGDGLVGLLTRRTTAARRPPRRADRGGHRGVRGRDADGPLPRRRGDRRATLLVKDLEKAVARATFHPVVPVCSTTGVGCTELLDLGVARLPVAAPSTRARGVHARRQRGPDADAATPTGPLVAEVVKTTSDPYVGRVSLVRVFSGTLAPDAPVHVSGHFSAFFGADDSRARGPRRGRADRRAGLPVRQHQVPADRVVAGDICPDRPAEPRRDRRHAVQPGRAAGAQAVDDARAAAAGGDRGARASPTRTSSPGARRGCAPRTPACGSSRTPRPTSWCSG